ncbi:hypothetical protein Leryth_024001 [Lithospermum erythrorhizon]|nr:hypothetical protein Leryth_024001 [Lithospermum erythrorhizon]
MSSEGAINNCNSASSDEGSEDDQGNNEAQGLVNHGIYPKSNKLENHTSKLGWKEGNVIVGANGNERSSSDLRNALTVAELGGEGHYAQYSKGAEGSNGGQKDIVAEKGVGPSGKKEGSHVTEPLESLRAILSDPLTGVLMDDAMILPCGHSFSNGGLEHVLRMKACYTCLHGVTEDSASPNLLLRAAVQAFRREEELHGSHALKRRRERYDQEKGCYGGSTPLEHSRRKGVQFPFALTDRVTIKGNKRTPPRFVGREAIVVNQCLNGWYVVKTVDNSEQVKLQYRSLAKVPDAHSSKPL